MNSIFIGMKERAARIFYRAAHNTSGHHFQLAA